MKENRKNKRNVPNLRFPEFTEQWEEKKLGEVMKFQVTNSFSRENLNYETGTVKNIHYGDIHTKFQTLFDITKENVPYINTAIPLDKISADFYCKEGDVVFADASEDLNDIGKSIEIFNLSNEQLLSGLHTLLGRPEPNIFKKGFTGYLFTSNNVRLQIQKEAQGTKVLSINVGRISNVKLLYPTPPEQQKIASFLTLIDERIATQSKIIDKLESLIHNTAKTLIKNKEPNVKLNECLVCHSSSLMENSINNNSGEYPVYGATGIFAYIDKYAIDEDTILIIKDGASVGRVQYARQKHSVIGTLNYLTPKSGAHLKFMYYCLQMFKFDKYKVGSGIPHIYFKDYGHQHIYCPSLEEQKRVASTLSTIDEKIETERSILEKYVLQKKYLLKQMFI